jgi:hypothetical protein
MTTRTAAARARARISPTTPTRNAIGTTNGQQ